MTTDALAHDGPTRPPSAGRLGAMAAVTPIAMFASWVMVSAWGGTTLELVRGMVLIGLAAIVAGWIIGARLGRSITSALVGLIAYAPVAYLVLLPLNLLGATLEDVSAGRSSNALELVVAATFHLIYGLVTGLYVSIFLLPFGVGWIVTFLILRRVFER